MFDSSIPDALLSRDDVSQGLFTIKIKFTGYKGPYIWLSKKKNQNISLQETTTYLVQSKPQTICISVECQAMSLTNAFDIDSLQQFPLVRLCRKFFMDSAIWRQEDASNVNICRTIGAHDHCLPTFVILIGLWDVNENTLLKYILTNNSRMQYFGDVFDDRVLSSFIECKNSCASRWNF